MQIKEGRISGSGLKVGVVVSRWNQMVTDRLLEGARDCFLRQGGSEGDLTVYRVPGGFEIPLALQKMAASQKYDALVALGTVIRGETPHFEYISSEVTRGTSQAMLKYDLPVGFGVLTVDTVEQAVNRAGLKVGNKGEEAMLAALEMVDLLKEI